MNTSVFRHIAMGFPMMIIPINVLAAVPVWERLSALDRARLGLALLAFMVLFFDVIAFVIVAARLARREIRKPLPPMRDMTDAWARKPLQLVNKRAGGGETSPTDGTGP